MPHCRVRVNSQVLNGPSGARRAAARSELERIDRVAAMYRDTNDAGVSPVRGCVPRMRQPGVWRRVGAAYAEPTRRAPIYRLIRRPALAEIVGDGRPWTVPMISLLSITLKVDAR